MDVVEQLQMIQSFVKFVWTPKTEPAKGEPSECASALVEARSRKLTLAPIILETGVARRARLAYQQNRPEVWRMGLNAELTTDAAAELIG